MKSLNDGYPAFLAVTSGFRDKIAPGISLTTEK